MNAIDSQQVEILFRSALAEVGLQPSSRETAGWTLVRPIATALVEGEIPPGTGAHRSLSRDCGHPGELLEMLQLHDEWESSVGSARAAIEAAIVAFAPEVIAAADRGA
ncbi:hypothetical protein [Mycobacterium sp. AZCC_0083]|uniref:hypothetical protein n=1 Tax=Mycobacterium sp. AZCC_0083 TaxID=2735882 RepID=UPI001612E6B0|nr:hypothetical protein [Mycobacterium sp. AZCC_0083]MBB5165946.1 hypothetical protein [Mycobacterium sp. AZCC_0083]